mmetsp:Transcript_37412/g.87253  ORF Transcript_37412/g.87253 Transcript_37412/m.87253 type:complete len:559 (-) Transcript_37412:188-1864(-)|eukprot:CAMPEP_0113313292 /NCGR_PEP_ID=MMETSP0010_2-20120614/9774_1 /TAXON_ID=216773 ORGANISM="Corethron hystrix, Strain 308" /NCGR_SAMPLE_ID=MMETSP0010_2 /ASSEMBLY_ACC=CAM_ASM_000155 /LENGTH=558 /DNA_ID=CAMNT_0000169275 /DNA_START=17 /DNA_END=1693 /DNA_ORIENTATION=- /assembly_acc=CAM_ASM_000155
MTIARSAGLLIWACLMAVKKVASVSTVLDNSGIQDRAISPLLGAGYSVNTGQFMAKCQSDLYDYNPTIDYSYNTFSASKGTESDCPSGCCGSTCLNTFNDIFGDTIAYEGVKADMEEAAKEKATENGYTHNVFGHLVVHRYYKTLDGSKAELQDQVAAMLQRSDWLGMVMICGPHYVRGIRRQSEVVFTISYTTATSDPDEDYNNVIMTSMDSMSLDYGNDPETGMNSEYPGKRSQLNNVKLDSYASKDRTTITVRGYGLNLSSGSFVGTSVESYASAMSAAFLMMTGSPNTGVVFSIEIVPWINNFWYYELATLNDFIFKNDASGVGHRVSDTLKRAYFTANAEHIVKLDSMARYKFTMLQQLTQCHGNLYGMSRRELCKNAAINRYLAPTLEEWNDMKDFTKILDLQNTGAVGWDETAEGTVIQAWRLLYLFQGKSETHSQGSNIIPRVRHIFNQWMTNVYTPCLGELGSSLYNMVGGTMFSKMWIDIPQCQKYSCLFESSVWFNNACQINFLSDNVQENIEVKWETLVKNFCQPRFQYDPDLEFGEKCGITQLNP